jgi:ubiquinone/menaquinone biosynthesis C-methylase UbiE
VIEKALEPLRNNGRYQVLDIGCGSGYAIKIMNSQFHNSYLHGIDISETCAKQAKLKNRKALNNNSLDIQPGNVADLSFEDSSMDIVTAFQTHYFWQDLHQACREIRRVLKPNGWFILSGDLYKMKYHLVKYQFIEEYPQLLKEEKFSKIEVFPFHGFMIAYSKK